MLLKIIDTKTCFPIITFKLVLDRLRGEMKSQKVMKQDNFSFRCFFKSEIIL